MIRLESGLFHWQAQGLFWERPFIHSLSFQAGEEHKELKKITQLLPFIKFKGQAITVVESFQPNYFLPSKFVLAVLALFVNINTSLDRFETENFLLIFIENA